MHNDPKEKNIAVAQRRGLGELILYFGKKKHLVAQLALHLLYSMVVQNKNNNLLVQSAVSKSKALVLTFAIFFENFLVRK